MKVGISVTCTTCHRNKAPLGRSVPDQLYSSLCTWDSCKGFYDEPKPGSLWPGETEKEFGYPIGSDGYLGRGIWYMELVSNKVD